MKGTQQIKKISAFLGPGVIRLLVWGTAIGFFLFAVELAFAFGLQAFLSALGVLSLNSVQLPKWFPHEDFNLVLVCLLSIAMARAVLQWLQHYTQSATLEKFSYLQRSRILRWAFFSESASSSETATLFAIKADNAGKAVMLVQAIVVQGMTTALLFLSILAISPKLTLIAIGLLGILLFPLRVFDRKVHAAGAGSSREWDKINRRLLVSIKNLLLLQIYGTQREEEAKAQADLKVYFGHVVSFARASGAKSVLPSLVGIFVICTISYAAKKYGALDSAVLLSFFYLFVRLVQNLSEILRNRSNYAFYRTHLNQTAEWWANHSPDGVRGKPITRLAESEIPIATKPIAWEAKSVSFRYPSADARTLDGVSLDVPSGSALVILGPSGVGKSTLLSILLGGLKSDGGDVRFALDGNSWNAFSEANRLGLLRSIGYVGPESFFIEGTVRENITYGLSSTPNEEELRQAIRNAECEFIFDLPKGLDHAMTEQGQGLSAGQKQRLGLARALLRKPMALILDEATANLDAETENRLVDTLAGLKGKMTIVGVTHRQALLKIADKVLRLGDGKVI